MEVKYNIRYLMEDDEFDFILLNLNYLQTLSIRKKFKY